MLTSLDIAAAAADDDDAAAADDAADVAAVEFISLLMEQLSLIHI